MNDYYIGLLALVISIVKFEEFSGELVVYVAGEADIPRWTQSCDSIENLFPSGSAPSHTQIPGAADRISPISTP